MITVKMSRRKRCESSDNVLCIRGDNQTETVKFILNRYVGDTVNERIDLNEFYPVVQVEPVSGDCYHRPIKNRIAEENKLILYWDVYNSETAQSGEIKVSIKFVKTQDSTTKIWQSDFIPFEIKANINANIEGTTTPPSVFDQALGEIYLQTQTATVQAEIATEQAEIATTALNQSKNLVGELNELKTAEQNTVVGAVNEIYDRAEAKQDKAFITCAAPFAITEPKIVIVAKTGSFAENEIKAYNITCNDTELANAWKQMSCKIGVAENTTSSVNQQVKIWLHSQKVKINNFSSVFGISSVVVGDIIYGWYGGYPSLTAISFCKNSLPIGVEFGNPYFKVGVVTGNNEILLLPQDGSKVDKINGKGLSTNDYTTAEKSKLAGINIPTPLKTTISTPVFQNQPTYSGVLSNYFKTGEQEFYYTVRKNTLYNDGWFRLQKACGNSSTTIAFDFQLGTGGTAYQTGSGYLSEGTAVDFINDNGIWKMRPRFLSSYVDIVLPIGLQKSDFTISISGQAQTPSNISILLLPFNTTLYNFVGTVAKYDGTSGFIFGYAGLPVKKFVFNEFNATVKRFKKTIHIDGVRSLASGDTFEAPYNVYREVSAGFAYDTTGGDITANISTVRISTVKLANYTEIILKEVV